MLTISQEMRTATLRKDTAEEAEAVQLVGTETVPGSEVTYDLAVVQHVQPLDEL